MRRVLPVLLCTLTAGLTLDGAAGGRGRHPQRSFPERAGIDVAFWFMEEARYTGELIESVR